MSNDLEQADPAVIGTLRGMARQGRSPSEMFRELKQSLGGDAHILTVLSYFRQAFHLTLAEAKPIAAVSRNALRSVEDEPLLDNLLAPAIRDHRPDWDA